MCVCVGMDGRVRSRVCDLARSCARGCEVWVIWRARALVGVGYGLSDTLARCGIRGMGCLVARARGVGGRARACVEWWRAGARGCGMVAGGRARACVECGREGARVRVCN